MNFPKADDLCVCGKPAYWHSVLQGALGTTACAAFARQTPEGYRLGDGWALVTYSERGAFGCTHPTSDDGDHCNREATYRHKTEFKRHPLWQAAACYSVEHAVALGALVATCR